MTIERLLEAGRAMEAGRLEQAERIYRQVADADPRSSIAIVGLARVAQQRGDETAATRLAEAALAVDPGNVAAQRLLGEHNAGRQGEVGRAAASSFPGAGATVDSSPFLADSPAGSASSPGASSPADSTFSAGAGSPAAADDDWPWPDLEEQLARYRGPEPGRLGRLLKRG